MNQRPHLVARSAPVPFSWWGWAMLLVILLSAAPTGGALRTQVYGSAFDPATYSVTTAPKRAAPLADLTHTEGEPGDPEVYDHPRLASAIALPPALAAAPKPAALGERPDRGASGNLIAHNLAVRGPPSS